MRCRVPITLIDAPRLRPFKQAYCVRQLPSLSFLASRHDHSRRVASRTQEAQTSRQGGSHSSCGSYSVALRKRAELPCEGIREIMRRKRREESRYRSDGSGAKHSCVLEEFLANLRQVQAIKEIQPPKEEDCRYLAVYHRRRPALAILKPVVRPHSTLRSFSKENSLARLSAGRHKLAAEGQKALMMFSNSVLKERVTNGENGGTGEVVDEVAEVDDSPIKERFGLEN